MKCPGQDTQYWNAGAIFEAPCPQCGHRVEFFKDDTSRKCTACGHRFINPRLDFGCASYCSYAEQCLGDLPPELVAQKEDLLKDRVAVAVKRHLKSDFRTIGRAMRRARYAEQLGKQAGVNLSVVLMAAYLLELDGPGDGPPENVTLSGVGLPVTRSILRALMTPEPLIHKVGELLRSVRKEPDKSESAEAMVIREAAARVAAEEKEKTEVPETT